jgi:PAS domain S-box-containing protein
LPPQGQRPDPIGLRLADDASFEALLSTNPVPMWVYDLETLRFMAVNEAALTRYGYSKEQFLSLRLADIRPLEDLARLGDALGARHEEFQRSGPWRHMTADGQILWVDITSRLVEWEGRRAALVVATELPSESGSSGGRGGGHVVLSQGAAFGRVVSERLGHARMIGGVCGVVVVDIASIEEVTTAAGTAGGYAMAQGAVARIDAFLRSPHTLARLGGTQIGLVLIGSSVAAVLKEAETIERAFRLPIEVPGLGPLDCPVSVGVRVAEDDRAEADTVVHEAVLAARKASASAPGRRFVVFDTGLKQRAEQRFSREQAVRRALQRGEFEVHYQPVVDVTNRMVRGYEALLRWRRPGGVVEPAGEVVRVAEETGLILDLGTFVRARAVADAGALLFGPGLSLAINLSPYELARRDLVAEVEKLCERSGLDPSQLTFELTETALVDTSRDFWRYQQVHDLRATGAKIAIDDFGTGYSSLSYLKNLPVDLVKIDRSFVTDLATSQADSALVEAITKLSHALGLSVVAEGVESEGELAVLRQLGVDLAQGFLFGGPGPLSEVRRTVRSGARWGADRRR